MTDTQKPNEVVALELVLQAIEEVYSDPAGEPRIRRKNDNPDEISWPIRSREMGGWVAKLFYENTGNLLTRGQIDRVLLYLEGKAEEKQRHDLELCDVIEIEPILGLLIRLVKHEQHLKTTSDQLLKRLEGLAEERIHALTSSKWPRSPETLGRRLRKLKPWLNRAGIDIEYLREARRRLIVLNVRKQTEPSLIPSFSNQQHENGLRLSDRNDGSGIVTAEAEFNKLMRETTN
jgi:hypothetical protein